MVWTMPQNCALATESEYRAWNCRPSVVQPGRRTWLQQEQPKLKKQAMRFQRQHRWHDKTQLACSSHGREKGGGAPGQDLARERDNGELVYLLRSIANKAPWVHRIWIAVNGSPPEDKCHRVCATARQLLTAARTCPKERARRGTAMVFLPLHIISPGWRSIGSWSKMTYTLDAP